MSELIKKTDDSTNIYSKLLAGTSVLALMAWTVTAGAAQADSDDRPQLWIELGGQLSRLNNSEEVFAPDLMANRPSTLSSSQNPERPSRFSFDWDGALKFQPKNSDWMFSASLRYGRSTRNRHAHQQSHPLPGYKSKYYSGTNHKISYQPVAARFADTNARNSETHLVLDFQAGKDVGLGILGSANGYSSLELGVRFAQFASKSDIALKSDPDAHFIHYPFKYYTFVKQVYHSNAATLRAARSFHGIGPSLSWSASAPFAGRQRDGEMSVDWSINASVLFGRQRARVHHQTTGRYHPPKYQHGYRNITYQPAPFEKSRSRSVTVPNIGGSLGLSYRMENFKMSAGYRADFFFGAMDGGIDSRKSEDRGFFGPYASVSIGLGG